MFIRIEDPGLGIFIPEIDNAVREAGGIPDGVIQISKEQSKKAFDEFLKLKNKSEVAQ